METDLIIHSFVDQGHWPSRTVKRLSKGLSKRCKKDLKQKKDYKIHYLFLFLLLTCLGRGGDEKFFTNPLFSNPMSLYKILDGAFAALRQGVLLSPKTNDTVKHFEN